MSQLQVVGEDAGECDREEFDEVLCRLAEVWFDTVHGVTRDHRFGVSEEQTRRKPRGSGGNGDAATSGGDLLPAIGGGG